MVGGANWGGARTFAGQQGWPHFFMTAIERKRFIMLFSKSAHEMTSCQSRLTNLGPEMTNSIEDNYRPLLEAIAFAARAHQGQLRKDGQTPYASHVFRVCLIIRQVFGIDDVSVLMAAVLHDTVEDTTTDYDDLQKEFGAEVAGWVADLSKDKR